MAPKTQPADARVPLPRRLFEQCNEAARMAGGFRVWKSAEASAHFQQALALEVTDKPGFRLFITDLVKGIWDGLDERIVKASPANNGKVSTDDLASRLAERLLDESFLGIKRLRNWVNHDLSTGDTKEAEKKQRQVGATLQRLVGKHWIADDDTAKWRDLWLAALDELRQWLTAVLQVVGGKIASDDSLDGEKESREQAMRDLADLAKALRRQKKDLEHRNAPTAEIDAKLLEIKRRLRECPQLNIGDCLSGRYELEEVLGCGGFATVWKAWDLTAEDFVAVKVLHPEHARSEERLDRFRRGARAMMGLRRHPNVAEVITPYAMDDGYHYFTMEYLPGGSLAKAVEGNKLTPEQICRALLEAGVGLEWTHGKGILHRDVSPDNILLDGGGKAKLTDYDLVWLPDSTAMTKTGAIGKYHYLAPEHTEPGTVVDHRCDVYSLGMTAIFAFHGKPLTHAVLRAPDRVIAALAVPVAAKLALRRSIEVEPEERHASVSEFCAALAEAFRSRPAREPIVSSIGMRLMPIPRGIFMMGSPPGEAERGGDEYQHEVEITRDFYLGETPVTQAEYAAVTGLIPSRFASTEVGKRLGLDTSRLPVENVVWSGAMEFCRQLTERDRKEGIIGGEQRYRLPTEAEWEYSCRGGVLFYQVFHFGNSLSSTQANFNGNYPYGEAETGPDLQRPTAVGSYLANAFGLYDMHGNVYEWCHDWYAEGYYASSPRRDPPGPSHGSDRVLRGGSWGHNGKDCRSAIRNRSMPWDRFQLHGFRVALVHSSME